jgi:hypothetical protein
MRTNRGELLGEQVWGSLAMKERKEGAEGKVRV